MAGATTCRVCRHDKRGQIEIGIINRVPARALAAKFDLSPYSIHRHSRNHLSPSARAAYMSALKPTDIDLEALERSEGEGLLGNLVSQRSRLQSLSEQSLELGDVRAANGVERTITSNLELTAKL